MGSIYILSIILITFISRLSGENSKYTPFKFAEQIVYTTTDKKRHNRVIYHYHPEHLKPLLAANGQYKIISFIGEQRIGKSTTLNKIISILEDQQIEPFRVGHELTASTLGIWMYIVEKCKTAQQPTCYDGRPCQSCINSDYSYVFLDIEGSDSATDDIALRYASIVTLISSKIFWMIKTTVSKHNMDMINRIETFRKVMDSQNVVFNFDDIDLNVIIREPLGNKIGEQLQKAINDLFKPYIGSELDEDAKLTESLRKERINVLKLDSLQNYHYGSSVQEVVNLILNDNSYKKGGSTVDFGVLSASDIIKFIELMINEFNENADLYSICIGCVFKDVVKWNEFGEWTKCDQSCDGGFSERTRTCNTGTIRDCTKFVGGVEREQVRCNKFSCTEMKWSEWSPWTQCTSTCGGGSQQRFRQCGTGTNQHCVDQYGGGPKEERKCNEHSCGLICSYFGYLC